MRLVIALTATLVVSAAIAVLAQGDPGFVIIGFRHWTVELTLALALALLLIGAVLLYILWRVLALVLGWPRALGRWRGRLRARDARRALTEGLMALGEGRWGAAQRELERAAAGGEAPVMSYLGAARAAQKLGQAERRDRFLELAETHRPPGTEGELSVALTRAELELADSAVDQAVGSLARLRRLAPRHPRVLRLALEIHRRLEDWDAVLGLLPTLERRKIVDSAEGLRLRLEGLRNRLRQSASGTDALVLAWSSVPRALRTEPALLLTYVEELQRLGAAREAETVVREALARRWNDELVTWYGIIDTGDPCRQLAVAEDWLPARPRNPKLLLSLGRLCRRARLWGKARSYLEASIGADPRPETYRELGQLLEELEEREEALRRYRRGLELSLAHEELGLAARPLLPAPRTSATQPVPPPTMPASADLDTLAGSS
jgi:HemY protein